MSARHIFATEPPHPVINHTENAGVYVPVVLVGMMSNLTALIYITLYMESLSRLFIPLLNLVASDVLLLVTGSYLLLYRNLFVGDWLLCKLMNSLDVCVLHVSCFTITYMAVDRLLILRHPRAIDQVTVVKRRDRLLPLVTWTAAALIAAPTWRSIQFNAQSYQCVTTMPALVNGLYNLLIFLTSFVLPGLVVTISYIVIIWHTFLLMRTSRIPSDEHLKITKVLAIIILLFWGCHLPFWLCMLTTDHGSCSMQTETTVLTYVNAATNPLVYVLLRTDSLDCVRCIESLQQTTEAAHARWSLFWGTNIPPVNSSTPS